MRQKIHFSRFIPIPKILVFALLCFGALHSYAQSWELTYGGQWQDGGRDLLPTDDGGFIAVGYSNSYSAGDNDVYVVRTDSAGQELWSQTYGINGVDEGYHIGKVAGGYVIAGQTGGPTLYDNNHFLLRIDDTGTQLWSKSYGDSLNQETLDMAIAADGGILLCGKDNHDGVLMKTDGNGNVLWVKKYVNIDSTSINFNTVYSVVATPDNGAAILSHDNQDNWLIKLNSDGNTVWRKDRGGDILSLTDDLGFVITESPAGMTRLDSVGNILWQKEYPLLTDSRVFSFSAIQTADGGFLLTGDFLIKTDAQGDLVWEVSFLEGNTLFARSYGAVQTSDGGFGLVGTTNSGLNTDTDLVLLRTDANGNLFSNFLSGQVFLDTVENCLYDAGESPLQRWLIKAEGLHTFYGLSDINGHYTINLDTGSYDITLVAQSPYLNTCDPSYSVQLSTPLDTTQLDLPVEVLVECPYLSVNLSTAFLRRCSTSRYYLNYCNSGTITAPDAYIELELDEFLAIDTAALPYTSTGNNNYIFELDDLSPGECGSFWVNVKVSCQSTFGQTHCSLAHIYPDSLCTPINPNWSGASIIVDASCDVDSVRFNIRNIGSGNMNAPLNYIVIEDVVMYMTQPFFLDSGESLDIALPANGLTYQLRAQQEPGHPGNGQPFAAIEGCGTDSTGSFSTGFIGMFPGNDGDTFIDVECRANIGPFDPNDKQGFPRGFGDDHLIEPNTAIDYQIRFQNTGTDTAFRVVVRDTISDFLDMESFILTSYSHPVEVSIERSNILKFTFDNIQLPDSNINEAASHGFIRFRIAQQSDLPDRTLLHNQAAIYFDFNPAIITNQTRHQVGTDFIQLVPTVEKWLPAVRIQSYPNPLQTESNIIVEGYENKHLQFRLFDLQGRLLRSTAFDNGQFLFQRNNLNSGIYFYLLEHQGQPLSSGKLIIQ